MESNPETVASWPCDRYSFENLDVYARKPISLERDSLFRKIVINHRGGYCFSEMNGLFYGGADRNGLFGQQPSGPVYRNGFDHSAIQILIR